MPRPEPKTSIKTIIFDFDGTIADSFGVLVETVEELLQHTHLSSAEITDLRGCSTQEIIKRLGIKKLEIPRLIIKGRRIIATKMHKVEVFDGMPEVIRELIRQGYTVHILSTNSETIIGEFLERNNLTDSITHIYANTGIFGKTRRLKQLAKHEKLNIKQCVYIGDETRDVEAAQAAKMPIISVGWGYSTPEILATYKPDALVTAPTQLLEVLQSPHLSI